MENNDGILARLSREKAMYTLVLDGESYTISDVSVSKIENPVRRPTSRGNVYVEESKSYRISANVDPHLAAKLSGTMLGPSTEFDGLHIIVEYESGRTEIIGGLLSMARTSGIARLQIAISKVLPRST